MLIVAPTSSGKTFISFAAMERVLRESDEGVGTSLRYFLPLRSRLRLTPSCARQSFMSLPRRLWSIKSLPNVSLVSRRKSLDNLSGLSTLVITGMLSFASPLLARTADSDRYVQSKQPPKLSDPRHRASSLLRDASQPSTRQDLDSSHSPCHCRRDPRCRRGR
jgi:hypothetical protein